MPRFSLYLILLLPFTALHAQDTTAYRQFALSYANDILMQTDRYLTQSAYFEYCHPALKHSPLHFLLLKTRRHTYMQSGLRLQQEVFTPSSTGSDTIQTNDRPYASTLVLTQFTNTINEKRRYVLNSALSLGITGPEALGRQTQEELHRLIKNSRPKGWQFQLGTSPVLNYEADLQSVMLTSRFFECGLIAGFRAGTLYNDVKAGIAIRSGNYPSLIRAPRYGTAIRYHFFCNILSRYVLYNSTLQGSLIRSKEIYALNKSDLESQVWQAHAGVQFNSNEAFLNLSHYWLSPEFKQGSSHAWTGITIGWRW